MDFSSLPLLANLAIFAVAAAGIWIAGTRLERLAGQLAERTTLGGAFTGMLLLAGATSLPELATTVTAIVFLGNPELAISNLLGGVALQTAIIVIADIAQRGRGALTYFSPRFVLLIQGVGVILLLQIAIAGVVTEGRPVVASVSVWSVLIIVAYLALAYLAYRYRENPRWTPARESGGPIGDAAPDDTPEQTSSGSDRPLRMVWVWFSVWAFAVFIGGWLAAQSADVLAAQTGLGDAFLGATLLALATSLPEVSTTAAAVRHGRHAMAISNIFGSNAFDLCLIFVADLAFREATVFAHAGAPGVLISAIAAAMTCLYLWGLMERENRTLGRIGWDSAGVLLLYMLGVGVLYVMR